MHMKSHMATIRSMLFYFLSLNAVECVFIEFFVMESVGLRRRCLSTVDSCVIVLSTTAISH